MSNSKIHPQMLIIIGILLMVMELTFGQNTTPTRLPLEKRMFIFSKTYASIPMYFAHWQNIPNLNLDSLYREFLPRVIQTEDRFQFDLLMKEFIGALKNGHSWYYDRWLVEQGRSVGFRAAYLDGEWVVTQSHIDGLKPGDILAQIDGMDFENFFQQKRKYINASCERAARLKFPAQAFLFPPEFVLKTRSGKQIIINRVTQKFPLPQQNVTGRWLENGAIAYIKIPGFGNLRFEEKAIQLVKEFSSAHTLIIDVRGNGGGNTPMKLVKALQDRPYRFWSESTPIMISLFKAYSEFYSRFSDQLSPGDQSALQMLAEFFGNSQLMWTAKYESPDSVFYRGKIIFLTDGHCASACEDFLVTFKDNKRAVLVGECTMGSSGQPYMISFDRDISVAIGTKREYFPDGSPFEGVGIQPDIEVHPTIADIKAGRDVVLEKALELAHSR